MSFLEPIKNNWLSRQNYPELKKMKNHKAIVTMMICMEMCMMMCRLEQTCQKLRI